MTDKIPSRKTLVIMPGFNWSAFDIKQTRMTPCYVAPHVILQTGQVVFAPVAYATVLAQHVEKVLNTHVAIGVSEFPQLEKNLLNAILISNNLKARTLYAMIQKVKRTA